MININVDIQFNSKNTNNLKFPIKLIGVNQCLHCGKENTLEKIDIFGNVSRQEIYPLDRIRCSNCGYEYSIQWKKDEKTNKLIPVPVNRSIKQEVVNTINYFNIRKNGEPEIPTNEVGEKYRGD